MLTQLCSGWRQSIDTANADRDAHLRNKDWGLNFNVALDAGGVLVSDKVTLEFDVAAVRAS